MMHVSNRNGAALIITLWALVFMAVIAAGFSFATRMGSASARNFKEDTQAYYLAVSAYEEAMAWILADEDPTIDFTDEEGVLHLYEDDASISGIRELEGATVTLEVSDEESRLNINIADISMIKNLLTYTGVPDDVHQEITDSLLDWVDPDDLHHLSGAEDEYYAPMGYTAKNALLDVPEELLLVKGFTPEYLYGIDEALPLIDYITTWGSGLNVNTISPSMMEAIGMDPIEVDSIMSMRRNGIVVRSIPRGLQRFRGIIGSSTFRITATAQLEANPMAVKITAIIKRTFGPKGPDLDTIYWKESIEYSRA